MPTLMCTLVDTQPLSQFERTVCPAPKAAGLRRKPTELHARDSPRSPLAVARTVVMLSDQHTYSS